MASKLTMALAVSALAFLLLASSAIATGVSQQRVAAAPEPTTTQRTATTSALIAPSATCPDQSLASPVAAQERAMLCMTNFARTGAGLGELAATEELNSSARYKVGDVLRCDSFSHFACGREFTYWIRVAGYIGEGCWHAGENLAWGTGEYGSVRAIFQAWMNSPTHRKNVLGDYDQVGIGLLAGDLEGHRGARVWVSHFGSHC
jgi:uncharacterized protein YkwD